MEQDKIIFLQKTYKGKYYFGIFLLLLPLAATSVIFCNTYPFAFLRPVDPISGQELWSGEILHSRIRDSWVATGFTAILSSLMSLAVWRWADRFITGYIHHTKDMSAQDFERMRRLREGLPKYNASSIVPPYLIKDKVLYVFKAFRTLTIPFAAMDELGICYNYGGRGRIPNDQVYIKTNGQRYYFHIGNSRHYTEELEAHARQTNPPVQVVLYKTLTGHLVATFRRNR